MPADDEARCGRSEDPRHPAGRGADHQGGARRGGEPVAHALLGAPEAPREVRPDPRLSRRDRSREAWRERDHPGRGRLKQHRYEDFQRFETAIRGVEEIVECYATGGGIDYLLKVVAPDIDAYQRLIDRLLLAEIGIDRYFTYIVTRAVKASFQPPVTLLARFAGR
jgi:DNA-binding Lrp family transcriptional regulator